MKTAIEIIQDARKRQVEVKGYDAAHDDKHTDHELAYAASAYAGPVYWDADLKSKGEPPLQWPFEKEYWKPSPRNRIKELGKAGAFIVAEIERLQRLENTLICLQKCEHCEKETDIETMFTDSASNYFCPDCWEELKNNLHDI